MPDTPSSPDATWPIIVGRYAMWAPFASGGMASVHLGRLLGPVGFSRTVAVKRLHESVARDPEFSGMFIDEARLAARIHHPNVVATIDVVAEADELWLVLEYVHGESFSRLVRAAAARGEPLPRRIVAHAIVAMLHGLHAAHEARAEDGKPLNIVHRDVSPQNLLLSSEGVPRLIDFGVAKAVNRVVTTRDGQVKGKLRYMAPEQMSAQSVDRRTDIFAAGVMLWECLTGRRFVESDEPGAAVAQTMMGERIPPSKISPDVSAELDAITLKALAIDPDDRFLSAGEMADALETASPVASQTETARWVRSLASEALLQRATLVADIESQSLLLAPPQSSPAVSSPIVPAAIPATSSANLREATGTSPSALSVVTDPSLSERRGARSNKTAIIGAGVLVLMTSATFFSLNQLSSRPKDNSVASAPPSAVASEKASPSISADANATAPPTTAVATAPPTTAASAPLPTTSTPSTSHVASPPSTHHGVTSPKPSAHPQPPSTAPTNSAPVDVFRQR